MGSWRKTASTIQMMIVAAIARNHAPTPIAIPTAAVAQMLAAVVRS